MGSGISHYSFLRVFVSSLKTVIYPSHYHQCQLLILKFECNRGLDSQMDVNLKFDSTTSWWFALSSFTEVKRISPKCQSSRKMPRNRANSQKLFILTSSYPLETYRRGLKGFPMNYLSCAIVLITTIPAESRKHLYRSRKGEWGIA